MRQQVTIPSSERERRETTGYDPLERERERGERQQEKFERERERRETTGYEPFEREREMEAHSGGGGISCCSRETQGEDAVCRERRVEGRGREGPEP